MNDPMLYVMIVAMIVLFGWVTLEYAWAGYQYWKERRQARTTSKAATDDSPQSGGSTTGAVPSISACSGDQPNPAAAILPEHIPDSH